MLQQPLLLVKGSVVVKNLVEEEPNMKWDTSPDTFVRGLPALKKLQISPGM
jgi:hypothetical protein